MFNTDTFEDIFFLNIQLN